MIRREQTKHLALMVVAGVVTATVTALVFNAFSKSREAALERGGGLLPQPIAPGQGSA